MATTWVGVPPEHMGLGPVHAVEPLLRSNDLEVSDIDYWELNEAFAGQVLACLRAMEDADYCSTHLTVLIRWVQLIRIGSTLTEVP